MSRFLFLFFLMFTLTFVVMSGETVSWGQGLDLKDRQVAEVRIIGLKRVPLQLAENQVRMQSGRAYDQRIVSRDIENLTRLGQFASVESRVSVREDGRLVLDYIVVEQGVLKEVAVVGNKAISDQDLLFLVILRGGDMRDQFLIDRGRQEMEKAYRDLGYTFVKIEVDKKLMTEQQVLVYRVIEGPRIKVWDLEVRGNVRFSEEQILSRIQTKTFIPVLESGVMSDVKLAQDVATIREFYFSRGYLDARVGRKVVLNAKQDRARVIFEVQEGPLFTVSQIEIRGLSLFSEQDLRNAMDLKIGDVLDKNKLDLSREQLRAKYHKLGYIDTRVNIIPIFQRTGTKVNVVVNINESGRTIVGDVIIRGNTRTQDKVARRMIRGITPGTPFDMLGLQTSEQRLKESSYFADSKISVMGKPGDEIRDVLVEVKETRTGSVSIGAAVSDSAGVVGTLSLSQTNFDIEDFPETFDELIEGQAFTGAGQSFNLSLNPGVEVQNYSISFGDPRVFDTNFSFNSSGSFRIREFDDYDETRVGGRLSVSRRLGDVYRVSLSYRLAWIDISDVEDDAPVDLFEIEGANIMDKVTISLTRSTVDSNVFPTRGNVLRVSLGHAGLLGDYNFSDINVKFDQFFTVDEDFFGKKSVFRFSMDTGYVFSGEAPLFERYQAGSRTFRGFAFRGVGPLGLRPNGTQSDVHVGGQFKMLMTFEYNFPIWEDTIRWVVFSDMGTIDDEISVENWRVTAGTGLRLKIPILGEVPLALDFAIPLMKQETDDTQVISFSLDLPLAN